MGKNSKNDFFIIQGGDLYKLSLAELSVLLLMALLMTPWLIDKRPGVLYYIYGCCALGLIAIIISIIVCKDYKKLLLKIDKEGVEIFCNNHLSSLPWKDIEYVSIRQLVVVNNKATDISWKELKSMKLRPLMKAGGKLKNVLLVKPKGKDRQWLSLTDYCIFMSHDCRKIRDVVSCCSGNPSIFSSEILPFWKEFVLTWYIVIKSNFQ